jgi:exodeoxyribonuclease VII large subunit
MKESKQHLTLYDLNRLVREVIECEMPDEYWVEAELSECRESRGHCYMELIQKDEQTATPVAKASAKCWASKWSVVRPYFERTTGQQLRAGMKVLLKVYPQFHEAYGFSWIVSDIDPTYTLGDMARKRQEIIRQLKEEGVFDLQHELKLPLFCQRIAVISSETAAGYGDFCHQLANNPYGFRFEPHLFPAIMQGEGVEQSIIAALNQIFLMGTENGERKTENGERRTERYDYPAAESSRPETNHTSQFSVLNSQFDCVVIIRGGGATSDMSGFDTLALAENVANFPIPIITGIGHERDESILDMVSHTRVKTPTAAAAFLIAHLKEVLDVISDTEHRMANSVLSRMEKEQLKISRFTETIPLLVQRRLTHERHRLELIEEKVKNLDPMLLLSRGYSITLFNGKAVRRADQLKEGDEIETRLEKGTIKSIIR